MPNDNEVAVVVRVRDFASRGLRKMLGAFRRFGGGAIRAVKKLKGALFSLRTLMVGAVAGGAVKMFTTFEAGMAQVSTLVDTAVVDMDKLASGVLEVGKASGDSLTSLTSGLFDAISAGVQAEDAIAFLGDAAKLGVGGGTDTASAIKGVVSLLNAYGLEATKSKDVSDSLFQAMKGGITTIGLLSSNVGKVAPVARSAGVGLDTMLAALSALTKGGLSTEEAGTALRSTLSSLIAPSDQAKQAAKELGIAWDNQTLKTFGLLQTLNQLNRKGLKPTAEQQAALAGSTRGFVGVAALAADGAKNFTGILDSMADKAGATDEAFEKVNSTLDAKLKQTWNAVKEAVIAVVGVFADDLKSAAENVKAFVSSNVQGLRNMASVVRAVFKLYGTIIKNFFSSDSNNAKAATQFYAVTLITIAEAGLKALVEIIAVGGKVAGAAFSLALGNEIKKGLNELARDIVDFSLGFGDEIAKELGLDLLDFDLFEINDAKVAEGAVQDIKDAVKNLGDIGEQAMKKIRANLNDFKDNASPEVKAAIIELENALDKMARSGQRATLSLPGMGGDSSNLTPLTGTGGALEGLKITPVGGGAGGSGKARTNAQGETLAQQNDRLAAKAEARLGALKEEAIARLQELELEFPEAVEIAKIEAAASAEITRFEELLTSKKISEEEFQRFRVLQAEETAAKIDGVLAQEQEQYLLTNEEISNSIATNFTDAFFSVIEGTKSVGQAFADMVKSILSQLGKLLLQRAIIGLLGGLFGGGAGGSGGGIISVNALGNVFSGGAVQKFASGGVVNGPTAFPMSGGMGLMGEAGPEAIMPLKRGAGGKLGVAASGGSGTVEITFQVVANDSKSFDSLMVERSEVIKGIVRDAIARDGSVRAGIAGVKGRR